MSEKDFDREETESIEHEMADPDSVIEGADHLKLLSACPDSVKQSSAQRIEKLLTDLIAAELAGERDELLSNQLGDLKIWLYNTSWSANDANYAGPTLDKTVLEITSPLTRSQLERVYVLDSGLSGKRYSRWKQACEDLFNPLFKRFISPQESPDVLEEFVVMRFDEALTNKLYLYQDAAQSAFFNALVIQAQPL